MSSVPTKKFFGRKFHLLFLKVLVKVADFISLFLFLSLKVPIGIVK